MRRIRARTVIFVILLCVTAMALTAFYCYFCRGVLVRIINKSGGAIRVINVAYTGGEIGPFILDAGRTFETHVNPSGESALKINFTDMHSTQIYKDIDTYFEHGYYGSIEIIIDANSDVTWIDRVQI